MTNPKLTDNVIAFGADRLGELQAQIAALKAEAKIIEDQFKAQGAGQFEGHSFVATVVEADRNTVDWKKVAAKLNPSTQLVTAHTKVTHVVSLRVTGFGK